MEYKEGQILVAKYDIYWYGMRNGEKETEHSFEKGTLFRIEPEASIQTPTGTYTSGVSPLLDQDLKIPLGPRIQHVGAREELKPLVS